MTEAPLRVTEAARRLGLTTKQVLVLIREGSLGYVMQDGIAHIPLDALDDFQTVGPPPRPGGS